MPMADPGFPRGVKAWMSTCYLADVFTNAVEMKIFRLRGSTTGAKQSKFKVTVT